MKRTITLMLVALFTTLPHSKENNISEEIVNFEAVCYNSALLFNYLKNYYTESPVIIGKASDLAQSTMTLWTNPIEDTWTIVATKGKLSCIIGAGTHFKVIPNKKSLKLVNL